MPQTTLTERRGQDYSPIPRQKQTGMRKSGADAGLIAPTQR